MEVSLGSSTIRGHRGLVPEEFAQRIKSCVAGGADRIGGLDVNLELRNSLGMQTGVWVDESSRRAVIVIDWAHCERLAWALRTLNVSTPVLLQRDAARATCARELRVYWRRRLAMSGIGEIEVEDLTYCGARSGEPDNDLDWSARDYDAAVRYAMYLLGHEIAHLTARDEPREVEALFERFEERYPRLVRPSPGFREELYCDYWAVLSLWHSGFYVDAREFDAELALIMALERFQSEIRASLARVRAGVKNAFDRDERVRFSAQRERTTVAEWKYRMFQVEQMLEEIQATSGADEGARAAARAVRTNAFGFAEEILDNDYMGWLG